MLAKDLEISRLEEELKATIGFVAGYQTLLASANKKIEDLTRPRGANGRFLPKHQKDANTEN